MTRPVGRRGAVRAVLAIALWLGFYVLGVVVVCALLLLPWAQITFEGTVLPTGVLCVVFALSVVWGMIPRFPKVETPGTRVSPNEHPKLHAFVHEVAKAAGAEPPDAIYIISTVNAYATSIRESRFSRKRRRVVGLGLPLFAMLDQDELASVVAHEFGHHTAGDVALGPWLYGTRLAIGTALERLEGSAFWLHLPFVAYGNLFLRITRSTSREQELSADRLAASCFGAASTATALLRVNDIDMTWPVYWDGEVIPVLERSRLPRVLEGFERFTAELEKRPKVVEDLARLKRESRQEASKPLDTHPSLRERLIALGTPDAASRRGARSSLQLFDDVAVAEKQIIQSILRDPNMPLEAFEWDAAAEAVWLPSWMDTIGPYREMFARIPPSAIPDALADAARWAPLLRAGVAFLSPQAERKRLSGLLGVHLAVRLHELGFTFTCAPGAAPSASKDGASVEPFVVVSDLEKGELSAADWKATCAKIGLD